MIDWGSLAIDFAIILVLILGISRFRTPRGGRFGNLAAALAMALALAVVVRRHNLMDLGVLVPLAVVGIALGWLVSERVNMIRIPSLVAIQNGAGGLASLLVSFVELVRGADQLSLAAQVFGFLGLVVGAATFSGSVVAAGKLDNKIRQTPVVFPHHSLILLALAVGMVASAVVAGVGTGGVWLASLLCLSVLALVAGVVFSVRIGGADMPVLISFLNSGSGLAAALCGMVIGNRLLIACGATVAVSGLILTQVMCRAMNRNLISVFTGIKLKRVPSRTSADAASFLGLDGDTSEACELVETAGTVAVSVPPATPEPTPPTDPLSLAAQLAREAESVIIVPGYGMALAHAASDAVALGRRLEQMGKDVCYAVHPVAGRMPGHMHVLLAEAEVDYDKLHEMNAINPRFADTDLALIVGACDVVNPQAVETEDTPISGMPILRADEARHVVVLNLDDKPGYSGVPNSLYEQPHTVMVLGDAKHSLEQLRAALEDGECAIDLPATG